MEPETVATSLKYIRWYSSLILGRIFSTLPIVFNIIIQLCLLSKANFFPFE